MNKDNLSHTVLKNIGFSLLAEGKTIKVKAEGYSMYPSVRPGSVIFIEPYGVDSFPVPGEIIAWKRESGFIVHRLVRCIEEENRKYYITRGDSSVIEDEPVLSDKIAGRVVKVENPEGNPVPAAQYINSRPNYSLNRFLVWIILQFSRVKRFFYYPS